MKRINWRKDILTIPNCLSLLRLIMIPLCISLYRNAENPRDYIAAAGILAVSCLTDLADGRIARKYHMVSTLGKILDPLADKATQFTLILCLSFRHAVLRLYLAIFVIKELLQAAAGMHSLYRGKILPGALVCGKLCTAVLFVSLILMVLLPGMGERRVMLLTAINLILLVFSFFGYALAYFGRTPKLEDLNPG